MSAGLIKGVGGGRRPNMDWSKRVAMRSGSGGGGPVGTAVDFLCRLETGSIGHKMTVADLNSSSLGLGTNSWSLVGTGTYPEWDSGGDQNTPGLSVGGVGYADPAAGIILFPVSVDPPADDYCLLTLSPTRQNLGLGFMYRFLDTDAAFWAYNGPRIDTGGGNYFSFTAECPGGSTYNIRAHGGGADGAGITVNKDTWYWITMVRTNNTSGVLKVWDPASSYAIIGTSTATLSGSDAASAIRFGITDAGSIGGGAPPGIIEWDDIALIYSATHIIPAP